MVHVSPRPCLVCIALLCRIDTRVLALSRRLDSPPSPDQILESILLLFNYWKVRAVKMIGCVRCVCVGGGGVSSFCWSSFVVKMFLSIISREREGEIVPIVQ